MKTTLKATVTCVMPQKAKKAGLYDVRNGNGTVIGQLEKYSDTRTCKHPWKAYLGSGMSRRFLRAFYPADGGKEAAIKHILEQVGY